MEDNDYMFDDDFEFKDEPVQNIKNDEEQIIQNNNAVENNVNSMESIPTNETIIENQPQPYIENINVNEPADFNVEVKQPDLHIENDNINVFESINNDANDAEIMPINNEFTVETNNEGTLNDVPDYSLLGAVEIEPDTVNSNDSNVLPEYEVKEEVSFEEIPSNFEIEPDDNQKEEVISEFEINEEPSQIDYQTVNEEPVNVVEPEPVQTNEDIALNQEINNTEINEIENQEEVIQGEEINIMEEPVELSDTNNNQDSIVDEEPIVKKKNLSIKLPKIKLNNDQLFMIIMIVIIGASIFLLPYIREFFNK